MICRIWNAEKPENPLGKRIWKLKAQRSTSNSMAASPTPYKVKRLNQDPAITRTRLENPTAWLESLHLGIFPSIKLDEL